MWGYEWNARDDLTRVLKNGVEQARFAYDPAGRRVEKVAGGVTTSYTYDGEDILREARGGTTLKYVHGFGADEPLAIDHGAELSYLHSDALDSVVKATNPAGEVTLTREYDAWGGLQAGVNQPGYAFTGREWDPETGLYYYRARYYAPEIARFIAEDPLSLLYRPADEANAYGYVTQNPVNLTDPLGLQSGIRYKKFPKPPQTTFCGPGDGMREKAIPEGIPGVRFTECCKQHDKCYDSCGKPRDCCDWAFADCLHDTCKKAGKSSTDPARPTLCDQVASTYFMFVSNYGGDWYNDAQKKCKAP